LRAVASFCGHRGALVNRFPDSSHSLWVLSAASQGNTFGHHRQFRSEAGHDELDDFAMRNLRQNFSHSFTDVYGDALINLGNHDSIALPGVVRASATTDAGGAVYRTSGRLPIALCMTPRQPKPFNATSWRMTPRLAIANNANRSTERRPVDWVFDA
jgi:hypothetical protein